MTNHKRNARQGNSSGNVTLVLAADRDQRFHWWRGTALSHSSPAKRGRDTEKSVWSFSLIKHRKGIQTEAETWEWIAGPYYVHILVFTSLCRRRNVTQTSKLSRPCHITITTIQNSGYIQKLCPLGEAHSIVSVLQLGVLGQLTAHHGHLLIHVHEKPIFCVLQEARHEKSGAWRTNLKKKTSLIQQVGALGDEVTVPKTDQSEESNTFTLGGYEY